MDILYGDTGPENCPVLAQVARRADENDVYAEKLGLAIRNMQQDRTERTTKRLKRFDEKMAVHGLEILDTDEFYRRLDEGQLDLYARNQLCQVCMVCDLSVSGSKKDVVKRLQVYFGIEKQKKRRPMDRCSLCYSKYSVQGHEKTAFVPCGHVVCRVCSETCVARRGVCVYCSASVDFVLYLFE